MNRNELITILEEANAGSRDLDEKIAFFMQWCPPVGHESHISFIEHKNKHDYETAWTAHSPWRNTWPIPRYTQSLDDSVKLVPEQFQKGWELGANGTTLIWSIARSEKEELVCLSPVLVGATEIEKQGKTPALGMCIAALRAQEYLLKGSNQNE